MLRRFVDGLHKCLIKRHMDCFHDDPVMWIVIAIVFHMIIVLPTGLNDRPVSLGVDCRTNRYPAKIDKLFRDFASLELERSEDASENVDRTSELLVREIRCRTEAQCIDAIVGEDSLVL